jgi:hypothetical protein
LSPAADETQRRDASLPARARPPAPPDGSAWARLGRAMALDLCRDARARARSHPLLAVAVEDVDDRRVKQ